MKFTTAAISLLPLFDLAAGQPSRFNHQGRGFKRHDTLFRHKRDHVPHEQRAVAAVYVDTNGNPVSTGVVASDVNTVGAATTPSAQATSGMPPKQAQGASGGGWSANNGVTYSPYTDAGGCKSLTQVENDINAFAGNYGMIRLYGVDCDQVATVTSALNNSKKDNKLFLGLFNLDTISEDASTMAAVFGHDWSRVDTISVGNELVNSGQKSVQQVIAALGQARSALSKYGYTGSVVIVDTFNAVIANPEICLKSDYCAVNMHPFFDPSRSASQAGEFMTTQLGHVRAALGSTNARVVVTETGWPWKGVPNGLAVPGVGQQNAAIQAIRSSFNSDPADVFLFSAFNDLWKKSEPSTFYAEQYWGIGKGPTQ